MKKLINIAAVLLAASMIFVGCSNGVAAPGSNNGGSGSGNEAGGSAGGEEKIAGEKIVCSGYSNYIELSNPVEEESGYTKVHAEVYFKDTNAAKVGIQLMFNDEQGSKQSSSTIEITTQGEFTAGEAVCLKGSSYTDWSTGSAVVTDCADKCNAIQLYVQDTSWQAMSDAVVYVKKVWLTAESKEDLVLFEYKAE